MFATRPQERGLGLSKARFGLPGWWAARRRDPRASRSFPRRSAAWDRGTAVSVQVRAGGASCQAWVSATDDTGCGDTGRAATLAWGSAGPAGPSAGSLPSVLITSARLAPGVPRAGGRCSLCSWTKEAVVERQLTRDAEHLNSGSASHELWELGSSSLVCKVVGRSGGEGSALSGAPQLRRW